MRRRHWIGILALVLALGLLASWSTIRRHVRAAQLLVGLEAPSRRRAGVTSRDAELAGLRARIYETDRRGPPVLLVHGVHAGGIDEPRLVRFAELLAGSGFSVATPEITAMTQHRLAPNGATDIADAARAFASERGAASAGVVGISFGGGLALIAASERPGVIHAVWAIGPHYDLRGLVRWWCGAQLTGPGGEPTSTEPESYGAQVLAYSFATDFFSPADREAAEAVLEARLRDDHRTADRLRRGASDSVRARLSEAREPGPAIQALADRHRDELDAISPRGVLGRVRAQVYLLHGLHDPVVASTESLHLAARLPDLGGVLRTALLGHADVSSEVSLWDRVRLVRHAAGALRALRGGGQR